MPDPMHELASHFTMIMERAREGAEWKQCIVVNPVADATGKITVSRVGVDQATGLANTTTFAVFCLGRAPVLAGQTVWCVSLGQGAWLCLGAVGGMQEKRHIDLSTAWSASTTDFDMVTVTLDQFPYDTVVEPELTMPLQPGDAVNWDVVVGIFTAASGGGTKLGTFGPYRNLGTNDRFTAIVLCDEVYVPANTALSLWVNANYGTATPTTGLQPASPGFGGQSRLRYRVRPQ